MWKKFVRWAGPSKYEDTIGTDLWKSFIVAIVIGVLASALFALLFLVVCCVQEYR